MATAKKAAKAVTEFVTTGMDALDAILLPLVPPILEASDVLTKASARFGEVTKPAYVAFLSNGKTQKDFKAWAVALTRQSETTVWNSLQAVMVLDDLPAGSDSLPVGALVSLASLTDGIGAAGIQQTATERRLAVLEAAGDNRSERNIRELVKAEKQRPQTADEQAAAAKKKADAAAKAVRDEVRDVLTKAAANPDAYSVTELLILGSDLHKAHGVNTSAGIRVVADEYDKEVADKAAVAKAAAEDLAKRRKAAIDGGASEEEADILVGLKDPPKQQGKTK